MAVYVDDCLLVNIKLISTTFLVQQIITNRSSYKKASTMEYTFGDGRAWTVQLNVYAVFTLVCAVL